MVIFQLYSVSYIAHLDKALTELAEILDELPKKCYIGGDFNIDLHDKKRNKHIQELEDITMSRGFFRLISIATHVKPGCKPSCIDNLITNDIENILISGIIEEKNLTPFSSLPYLQ